VFNDNPELIAKMEGLWMITHQKPCVLASKIISLGMVRKLIMQMKGKKMNWAIYVEWTN
jgi:hypothetical protein